MLFFLLDLVGEAKHFISEMSQTKAKVVLVLVIPTV